MQLQIFPVIFPIQVVEDIFGFFQRDMNLQTCSTVLAKWIDWSTMSRNGSPMAQDIWEGKIVEDGHQVQEKKKNANMMLCLGWRVLLPSWHSNHHWQHLTLAAKVWGWLVAFLQSSCSTFCLKISHPMAYSTCIVLWKYLFLPVYITKVNK